MKNYVISLTQATDRRAHITEEFGKQNIAFEFFDAITPATLAESFDRLGLSTHDTADLSKNELSCLASHVSLWQKMLDDDLDYIGIFEDDIYLSHDAHLFLTNSDWIQSDWNLIKIEKTLPTVLTSPKKMSSQAKNHSVSILQSKHLGAGGYIISNKAATTLLNYLIDMQKLDHVDQILFNHIFSEKIINIHQINPVLCIQDCILNPTNQRFTSSLQWRDVQQTKNKIGTQQKIVRELSRIYHQIITIPNKTKLKFHK